MTKILFIVPPGLAFNDFVHPQSSARHIPKKDGKFYGDVITDMPLGILSLSAYLKDKLKNEVDTKLLDYNLELNKLDSFPYDNYKDFFEVSLMPIIEEYQPDIIGISVLFSTSYYTMLEIAAHCRQLRPQALILGGGGIPSVLYREIYQDSQDFDALCYGEGELPFIGLLQAQDKLQYLAEHSSWITRKKVEDNSSFKFEFIDNLDEIPFLDYEICDLEGYSRNSALNAYITLKDEKYSAFYLMTSRGCPFKCVFCASHAVHGRTLRYYSYERVVEDFTKLKEKFNAKMFAIMDDHFLGDRPRALRIVRLLHQLGLTAFFLNGLAPYALDTEMLEAFKQIGVKQLPLSVESGSDRVLKYVMRKPLKLTQVSRVVAKCRELGIYTNINILIGLPGETKEDIEESRVFLRTIYADWFHIYRANPLVGSELYNICVENDYIKGGLIGCDFRKAVIETKDFTSEYIQEMAYTMNLDLNFVHNSDFRLGHYDMALRGFENTIRIKHDHALALYYAGKCYEFLGNQEKAEKYSALVKQIYQEDEYWRNYCDMFAIPVNG